MELSGILTVQNPIILSIWKQEDNEWKDDQKKDTNKRPSETRNRRKVRKKIINKTSYFLSNSVNKSLNHKWQLKISPRKSCRKIRKLFYEKWIPFQQ